MVLGYFVPFSQLISFATMRPVSNALKEENFRVSLLRYASSMIHRQFLEEILTISRSNLIVMGKTSGDSGNVVGGDPEEEAETSKSKLLSSLRK